MAYFEKRGDKWYYTISLGRDPVTKKQKQLRRVGGRTKKEAQAVAKQHEIEIEQGTFIRETELLFPDFAQQWLETFYKGVKVSTKRARSKEINLLNLYFGRAKVKDITKLAYQEALDHMFTRPRVMTNKTIIGYSKNTVSGVHGTGQMIFKKAKELDIIKMDPTEYAKVIPPQQTVEEVENEETIPKYLEKEDLNLFLQIAKQSVHYLDYPLFLVLAYSGIRAGELCALKWSDVDFESQQIRITKTYYNPTNNAVKYILQTPKTKSSKRDIHLEPIVFDALAKYRTKQREYKMLMRDQYYNEDFVFVSFDKNPGYPIFVKTIENRMRIILKRSELSVALTPHSLRHTHTSLLAEAEASLEEIMERLGHKDDSITKNVYLHVTKNRKKDASRKFGQLMSSLPN